MQNSDNHNSIYVSLGSNCGDAQENLKIALKEISAYPNTNLVAQSSYYQTEPQGDKDQNWFYNQVVRLDFKEEFSIFSSQEKTNNAYNLIDFLLSLETKMGRVRDKNRRFGPRIIDLDIIYFGTMRIDTEKLIIPHPRFLKRAFILIPLQEIASDIILYKTSFKNIYADLFIENLFQEKKEISIKNALQVLHYTVEGNKIFQA